MESTKKDKPKFKDNIKYLVSGYGKIISMNPQFLPFAFILAFINALQPMAILFFSARILNELSGARELNNIIFYTSAAVALTFILSVIKSVISAKQELNNGFFMVFIQIMTAQAEKFATMDYAHTENSEIRNTLNDIETKTRGNGVGLMRLYHATQNIVQHIFSLIIASVLLVGMFTSNRIYTENFATSSVATIILIVFIAVSLFTVFLYQRKEKPFMETIFSQNAKGNSTAWYYMSYIKSDQAAKDIRLYNQKAALMDIFKKNYGINLWIKFHYFYGRLYGYSSAVMSLIGGATYLLIGLRALAGMYEIGSVVQYVGAVTALVGCFSTLVSDTWNLYNNCVYIKPLIDYLNLPDILPKNARPIEHESGQDYQFEFRNVSFKYPGNEKTDTFALKNLNLTIHSGQRLAVVGLNGSGKTTMIKLLCRLYDPDEGEILFNGINIKEYDYKSYYKLFSVVFQDFKLFPLQIGQNIAVSLKVDEARLMNCIESAGFSERLKSLEKKLDTVLYKNFDEDGVEVSGGEAQKIALARALYKDAPVIILDEPTAALDPISEYEIYTTFNKTIGNKTAVFISHRLSSCRFCHDIAVFEGGKLIQRGTHDELLADISGRYYELWTAQAQHYEENNEMVRV